ncbi:MAG: peptidoglycan-binding protein LysM [Pseudomonadota bacterium]|nr:peptidoglycan-binding protein LysM [Pseudomonadota bacterium]
MSLISFIADAGEKLLGGDTAGQRTGAPAAQTDGPALNAAAAAAITKYIGSQNLTAQNLDVKYDGASKTVTVSGVAPNQATKEKIVLCCGNVSSVAKVDDRLTVASGAAPAASFYEVKSGDSLSKIAKDLYGDASQYMKIFEANKPMLSDPNKIYPGQQLRIPAKA